MVSLIPLILASTLSCSKSTPVVKPPSKVAFSSREVKFDVPDLTLEGTFELPIGTTGKVPAILLIPGSGPTDRNGNSGFVITTDLLKQIAEELAKNGIASLRFDKRAIRHYSSKWPKDMKEINHFFRWESFVNDASAAFDFLASQPEVDGTRVGILGHSEGALISLQIGSDRRGKPNAPKATFLMGSTGRPMGIIIHEQIARELKNGGASEAVTKQYLDYVDSACSALKDGKPLPPGMPTPLGALFNPAALDIVGAYCRIDPVDLAKKVQGPVLVMNGAHDTQVSAERDTPRLLEALKSRKTGQVEALIVSDASHNFKNTKGSSDDAFNGPMVAKPLALIVKFAKANL